MMFERSRNVTVELTTKAVVGNGGDDALVTTLVIRVIPYDDHSSEMGVEFSPEDMLRMLSGAIIQKEMRVSGRTL